MKTRINIRLKTLSVIFMATLSAFMPAKGADANPVIYVSDASMQRQGDVMGVSMNLNFNDVKLKSSEALVFSPMIVNGPDTLILPEVGVYGRTSWYQSQRAGKFPLGEGSQTEYRYKKDMPAVAYSQFVDYADWMNGSKLLVKLTDYGCAECGIGEGEGDFASYKHVEFQPVFIYQEAAVVESKTRELSGRAYIDFKVNKTDILPTYRNNAKELQKITGTIDSVRNDKDVTVTSISIKGTASPEGSYENNVRLAKGRTEALKNYVQKLYSFPEGFIKTSYEPVDWDGLREWLQANSIDHKAEILDIVNGDLPPYQKNQKIKTTYPKEYAWLLENVYPSLRHSDYRIEYDIRQFSDVKEIAELMVTEPQKLSLNEMYLLAGSMQKGSTEYNEVFETAVRMFPVDETANLNAANSAMQRGDLPSAARYLERAGNSAEALYAKGILSALQGNYPQALDLVNQAAAKGLAGAAAMGAHLQEVME